MVDRDVELLIDELYADAHDLEDVAVSFNPPQLPPPHTHGAVASLTKERLGHRHRHSHLHLDETKNKLRHFRCRMLITRACTLPSTAHARLSSGSSLARSPFSWLELFSSACLTLDTSCRCRVKHDPLPPLVSWHCAKVFTVIFPSPAWNLRRLDGYG